MEPVSVILSTAVGYALKAITESKAADTAKEEVLGKFWKWIKPCFLKELPQIETANADADTASIIQAVLAERVKDEPFLEKLVQELEVLKRAGIKEKNIVSGDIAHVKKVAIGDKTDSPYEQFDRKNIVEGNITNVGEFNLGDGH